MKKVTYSAMMSIILFSGMVRSQSLDRMVIGAAGDYQVKENLSLSFTIGEPAVSFLSSPGIIVIEGFQQGDTQGLTVPMDQINFINGLQVYPNPTDGLLNLGIPGENQFEVSATLYDILGKKVDIDLSEAFNGSPYQIDLSELSIGTYQLVVKMENDQLQKIFKLLKIN